MSLMEWQERYSLGVEAMDRDHKKLLEAMNKVHELATTGASRSAVDASIHALISLTKEHFAAEELHMESIGYADLARHSLIHKDMLKRVADHYRDFQAGDGAVAEGFFDFLVHWLAAHICHIDRKYAQRPMPVSR